MEKRWNGGCCLGLGWSDRKIWRSRPGCLASRICGRIASLRVTSSGLWRRKTFWTYGTCLLWSASSVLLISTLIVFHFQTAPAPISQISRCLTRSCSNWKNSFCIEIWMERACFACWANRCKNDTTIKREILWKMLELIFVTAFFQKDDDDNDGVFNASLDFSHFHEEGYKYNSLLTKCVIQIVSDTLR